MSMKLSNQGLSSRYKFIKLIESIGFEFDDFYISSSIYNYNNFRIDLYDTYYAFHNGFEWFLCKPFNDLEPINNYFKNEIRSIKLKNILR